MKNRSINLGLLLGAGLTAMIRKIITVGYTPLVMQEFALVCWRLPSSWQQSSLSVIERCMASQTRSVSSFI
ncbi:MAG: hypothetical protein ACXV5T_09935 [Halobacteriota archaeon]